MSKTFKKAAFEISKNEEYEPRTLIIGGGIAGLACAEKLSKEKIPSILVEKEEALGGQLQGVSSFYHANTTPQELLEEKIDFVRKDPNIEVLAKTTVKKITGLAGNFSVEVNKPQGNENLDVGSIVFATGYICDKDWPVDRYGIKPQEINHALPLFHLEGEIESYINSSSKLSIAILLDEDDYLIGPGIALKNAYYLQKSGHQIYFFYEELKLNEEYLEPLFVDCKSQGVKFIKNAFKTMKVEQNDGLVKLYFNDPFDSSNEIISLTLDLMVYNEAIVPGYDTIKLASEFNINRYLGDGFLQEDNYHLLPVETNKLGVYAIGGCRKPDFIWNIISEAEAAAEYIYRTLLTYKEWIKERPVIVDPNDCVSCLTCFRTCPRHAVYIDKGGQCKIHRPACGGCGMCVCECPNTAIKYPQGLNLREKIGPEGSELK